MTTWLFAIWLSGVFAAPNVKVGFFRRFNWPFELGERLAEMAWRITRPGPSIRDRPDANGKDVNPKMIALAAIVWVAVGLSVVLESLR